VTLFITLSLTLVMLNSSASLVPLTPPARTLRRSPALEKLNNLPLFFVANKGQADVSVEFVVHSLGGTLFFTPGELILSLPKPATAGNLDAIPTSPAILRVQFTGANPDTQVSGGERLPGYTNYLIGNEPKHWRTDIAAYANLAYTNLYPGIDLRYEGRQGSLKSTYTVAPGADPGQIRWRYSGADGVRLEPKSGDLLITVPLGQKGQYHTLREQAPIAWQEIDGRRAPVEVSYIIAEDGSVSFGLGNYDPSRTLVIDPLILAYSTYLGGSGFEIGYAITVDAEGAVYITGNTISTNFPTRNAYQNSLGVRSDVFVTKLDPDQSGDSSLIYSTYLGGGSNISANEGGLDIAVDDNGNVYITGFTQDNEFPIVNGYDNSKGNGPSGDDTSNDVFVAKLSPAGNSLLYSTYLGGDDGVDDVGNSLVVDDLGNVYVSGLTASTDFPTENAYQGSIATGASLPMDAFVTRLDTTQVGTASLVYSTYLGGSEWDISSGVAVDNTNHVYVSGYTRSPDFPTRNAYQSSYGGNGSSSVPIWIGDAFVAKLDITQSGDEALIYSTYLGGSSDEGGTETERGGIALDGAGYIYLVGETTSDNFPTKNAYQSSRAGNSDLFAAKLDLSQTGEASLVYSTYLGGTNKEVGHNIAVDSVGNAYLVGFTLSDDFPTEDAYQESYAGGSGDCSGGDAFITQLASTGNSLLYSSYLGGTEDDLAYSIVLDNGGNIYVAGTTASDDFPTQNAYQSNYPGGCAQGIDAFVTKFAIPSNDPTVQVWFPPPGEPAGPVRALTLQNTGTTPLILQSITASNGYSQTNDCPFDPASLLFGASCTITVSLNLAAQDLISGTLTIVSNAPTSPDVVNLSNLEVTLSKTYLPVIRK
jgi:hypothetical protein